MLRVANCLVFLVAATPVTAQASVVVPAALASLPGNAALSLPLRWSHGVLQVRIDNGVLPAALVGQTISGLSLRRPTFLGEPAYPPVQRTLTVRGGFQAGVASQLSVVMVQNHPANLSVLFGPAPVTSAATPAPGAATVFGDDLLHIQFTQPLPVVAGSLFLEFETSDAPLQVAAHHWVDALWMESGQENGYVATVGDGSCTTRPEPTELRWDAEQGPQFGQTARFLVRGAPPTIGGTGGVVVHWLGVDPQTMPPGPIHLGFGASLGIADPTLAGCAWWAPLMVTWGGTTDPGGMIRTSLPLNGPAVPGLRLAVQAAWIDDSRPGLPFSVSNGLVLVMGGFGVGPQCGTVFFPAGATTSPWPVFLGQMPVLRLEY